MSETPRKADFLTTENCNKEVDRLREQLAAHIDILKQVQHENSILRGNLTTAEQQLAAVKRDAERYRRAVVDLAGRGYGVRRPAWLIETIDAAIDAIAGGEKG